METRPSEPPSSKEPSGTYGFDQAVDESTDYSSPKASKRQRCRVCSEAFDTLLLTVRVKKGRAHPLCAVLNAVGLKKLATTSGHW